MDFKVIITEDKEGAFEEYATFDQFHLALGYIKEKMAVWNNFNTGQTMLIKLQKVPSQTETLGVSVNDVLDITEMIGG